MLGQPVERFEKGEGSNLEYADYLLEEHLSQQQLSPKMKARLRSITQSEVQQDYKQRFLAYQVEVEGLPVGPGRSHTLAKGYKLPEDWVEGLDQLS